MTGTTRTLSAPLTPPARRIGLGEGARVRLYQIALPGPSSSACGKG